MLINEAGVATERIELIEPRSFGLPARNQWDHITWCEGISLQNTD